LNINFNIKKVFQVLKQKTRRGSVGNELHSYLARTWIQSLNLKP